MRIVFTLQPKANKYDIIMYSFQKALFALIKLVIKRYYCTPYLNDI